MDNRNILNVLDKMLVIIPKEQTELLNELNKYKGSLWNQAPEALCASYNWEPVQHILNNNITNIDTNWKLQLLKIFNDTE